MTPIAHFEAVWKRCDQLSALYAYLSKNVSGVLQPEELLRAEWVTRVSSLDLYIHELVAQEMLATFNGGRPVSSGYSRFQISNETLHRIRTALTPSDASAAFDSQTPQGRLNRGNASTPSDASAAFDLEVRDRLSYLTFQDPDKIAEGIRLISNIELWNEVALKLGATLATKAASAKHLKMELSLVVQRRNKIAHEGDLHSITQYSK